MQEGDLAHYARHSRWTEPGLLSEHLERLPTDPVRLPGIVGGLVLHPIFASRYGIALPAAAMPDAPLRTIDEILKTILDRDDRPLDQTRDPGKRFIGVCRQYALLACAVLRQHRVPARLRVGFADYFTPDFAEVRFDIPFEPADVPRGPISGSGWLMAGGAPG
jgi:Transglutaminase-like superfamily